MLRRRFRFEWPHAQDAGIDFYVERIGDLFIINSLPRALEQSRKAGYALGEFKEPDVGISSGLGQATPTPTVLVLAYGAADRREAVRKPRSGEGLDRALGHQTNLRVSSGRCRLKDKFAATASFSLNARTRLMNEHRFPGCGSGR